jgi:hypothetical protein
MVNFSRVRECDLIHYMGGIVQTGAANLFNGLLPLRCVIYLTLPPGLSAYTLARDNRSRGCYFALVLTYQ